MSKIHLKKSVPIFDTFWTWIFFNATQNCSSSTHSRFTTFNSVSLLPKLKIIWIVRSEDIEIIKRNMTVQLDLIKKRSFRRALTSRKLNGMSVLYTKRLFSFFKWTFLLFFISVWVNTASVRTLRVVKCLD